MFNRIVFFALALMAVGCAGQDPTEGDIFSRGGIGTSTDDPLYDARLALNTDASCGSSDDLKSVKACVRKAQFGKGAIEAQASVIDSLGNEGSYEELLNNPLLDLKLGSESISLSSESIFLFLGDICAEEHFLKVTKCDGTVELYGDHLFGAKRRGVPKVIELGEPNLTVDHSQSRPVYVADFFDLIDSLFSGRGMLGGLTGSSVTFHH